MGCSILVETIDETRAAVSAAMLGLAAEVSHRDAERAVSVRFLCGDRVILGHLGDGAG